MEYVEAPQQYTGNRFSVFLAGGITGCPDWQSDVVRALKEKEWAVFNPRRANFPIHDPAAAREQIEWEFKHLRRANAILFWFPCETLCPIVLYELGRWAALDGEIFVGVHPDYARKQDVEIQLSLARPDVHVVYSLDALIEQAWNERGINV
jgi:hypothetical protein